MAFETRHPFLNILMVMMSTSFLQMAYGGKQCGPYNWGKRFFLAVPGHHRANYYNYPVSYNISLTIRTKESGNVTILARGHNISASYAITKGETSLNIPETVVQSYGQPTIQRKGIRITSTTKVSAKLIVAGKYLRKDWRGRSNWYTFQAGEIDLLPASSIDSKYTVPFHGRMGIHIVGLKKAGFTITYEKDGKRQKIEGKLRKFDSFLLNGTFPSGINLISSDAPVALFFHASQQYESNYQYVNQIAATVTGSEYIIPVPSDSRNINLRAVAIDNGTIIEVKNDSRTYIMMLDAGEYIQSMSTDHFTGLSANKGIVVTRHYYGFHRKPVIAPVPALSLYCNGYVLDQDSYGDMTVVVASDHKDEFMFNERDIPWWSKVSYFGMHSTEYFVAKMTLAKREGFREIHLRNQNVTFGGFLDIQPLGSCG